MARHLNHNGKKVRGIGITVGITKHRVSGHTPNNRRTRMLECRDANIREEAERRARDSLKPQMFSSASEAIRKGR